MKKTRIGVMKAAVTGTGALLAAGILWLGPAEAQGAEQITVGDPLPRFDLIRPQTRRYLRHRIVDGRHLAVDIWTREIRIEEQAGERRLHIVQRWDGAGESSYVLELDSWFELGTFRPFTHERRAVRGETVRHERFRFEANRIVGEQLTQDGPEPGTLVTAAEPAFNFETDMEFLSALPWKEGYEAQIVFYHPGGTAPAPYVFRAAGAQALAMPDGAKVDCWLVTTDYNTGASPTKFWLDKRTQAVLKVESPNPADGSVLVKTLLY